jgi:hypothetical protein
MTLPGHPFAACSIRHAAACPPVESRHWAWVWANLPTYDLWTLRPRGALGKGARPHNPPAGIGDRRWAVSRRPSPVSKPRLLPRPKPKAKAKAKAKGPLDPCPCLAYLALLGTWHWCCLGFFLPLLAHHPLVLLAPGISTSSICIICSKVNSKPQELGARRPLGLRRPPAARSALSAQCYVRSDADADADADCIRERAGAGRGARRR